VRRLAIPSLVVALTAAPTAAAAGLDHSTGLAQPRTGPEATVATARASAAPMWATVNICDSPESPNSMGVRAAIAGNGRAQRMYMRFTAQWWSGVSHAWDDVPGARSPWIYVGSARYVQRQSGWTFAFNQPATGGSYILRGRVELQWREGHAIRRRVRSRRARARRRWVTVGRRWVVVKDRELITAGGLVGVDGGQPAGTSLPLCGIV
jgi:hypothetical protein